MYDFKIQIYQNEIDKKSKLPRIAKNQPDWIMNKSYVSIHTRY